MEERGRRLLQRAVEVTDKLDLPAVLAPNLRGWNREQALNGAGYPYEIVQRIVNSILD